MHFDLGRIVRAGEALRKCGDRVELVERPAIWIIRKRGDGRLQFIDDVCESPVGIEAKMTRSGARIELGKGRVVRRQGTSFGVETLHQQLIESQVDGDGETIVGRGLNPVRMRAFLPLFIDAGARVLHEGRSLADAAVGLYREDSHVSSRVVRHQGVLSGLVERDVARVGAARCDFIQEG